MVVDAAQIAQAEDFTDPDEFLKQLAGYFSGELKVDPDEQFFTERDVNQQESNIWDDTDWWTGEEGPAVVRTEADRSNIQIAAREKSEAAVEMGIDPWAQSAVGVSRKEQREIESWSRKYKNGYIPTDALDSIGGGLFLRPDAASSYKAMIRAARRDGIRISATDGYRDYEGQVRVYREKPDLAAVPGTSRHGLALATDLDLSDPKAYAWLREHGAKYGWQNPPWARDGQGKEEPWHWEYTPNGKTTYKPGHDAYRNKVTRTTRRAQLREVGTAELDDPSTPIATLPTMMQVVLGMEADKPTIVAGKVVQNKGGNTQAILNSIPKKYRDDFRIASKKSGVPLKLLYAVSQIENPGYDPNVVSSAGAVGLMQLMPVHWQGKFDPTNARRNVVYGAGYLASLITQFDGNLRYALAAYNAGPGSRTSNPAAWSAGLDYAARVLDIFRGGQQRVA